MSAENNGLDEPQLSAETLKALKEFYEEQNEKILNLCGDKKNISDIKFDEDWQLSQFWYDENTCEQLVKCAVQTIGSHGTVALISCPTLYKYFKNNSPSISVKLFEYDKRFSAYGIDYEFYDYNEPLKLNNELFNFFDLVIVDPPFLSEECLTKSILTATNLTKNNLILCTGEVMEDTAKKLINLHKCSFIPKHKNNLDKDRSRYYIQQLCQMPIYQGLSYFFYLIPWTVNQYLKNHHLNILSKFLGLYQELLVVVAF